MNRINDAFAAWNDAHARLVEAERHWGAAVVQGDEWERAAARERVTSLRGQTDELLRRASATLEAVAGDRPR